MNNNTDIESAETSLRKFMADMNAWEVKFHVLYQRENGGPEVHREEARLALAIIYAMHLTKKDTKTGRMAGPSAGYPPEFDLAAESIENIEKIGPKKILITTKWIHPALTTMTESRRYTMVSVSGEWKLDKKEVFRKLKDKWENRVL